MKFVADLHLHSKYSRAVSPNMILPNMALWAKYKGINVIATGDFTHPFWLEQLKNELEEKGNGLFRLKTNDERLKQEISFMLSCEISSIYSQGGKGRRIHNLFFFPNLESVEKFNKELIRRGSNLRSDGRPIVGISSRDLAKIALDSDSKALVIPAHAWTPWFSVFGSFSGFDSIEECFGDMASYIYGIETGLSSDPAMNWQIEDLDDRAILSFSDAHSLEKMGREATVFEAEEVSYEAIYDAISNSGKLRKLRKSEKSDNQKVRISDKQSLRSSSLGKLGTAGLKSESLTLRHSESSEYSVKPKIAFTIEFYPEEGKYHFTGHRDCNFSQSPEESKKIGNICPVCRRPLTVGVMDRVEQLRNRSSSFKYQVSRDVRWIYPEESARPPYISMVPLGEILAEVGGVAVGTKKVQDQYLALVGSLDSEFNVLIKAETSDIEKIAGSRVAEGIDRVRSGLIAVEPGYDGKFGVVKIWATESKEEKETEKQSQLNLFV